MPITLTASTPFSLPAVINSHGWIQLAPFQNGQGSSFSYVARLSNGRVLLAQVDEAPNGVRLTAPGDLTAAEQEELAQQVAWMVGLDHDLSAFYELVRDDADLGHVVREARGRLLRSPTLFEDVVKTILTTNTAWSGTIRMTQNVVNQFGAPLPGAEPRRAFPTPEQLSRTTEDTLRSETGLGYRAPYVLNLARAVDSGELALEPLKDPSIPTEELRRRLLSIKGVGNYAAANLLLLLGRTDYIPIDSYALRMVSTEWHNGDPITPAEVEAAFAGWGRWKGLAYWFWNWKGGD
jgi:3-methyladenine DNA glycosylase/8-oxoguanine DNA glycosylase